MAGKNTAFDNLPSRVRYYLLDYKDTNLSNVLLRFGKGSLREFNKAELSILYKMCIFEDSKLFTNIRII